MEITHKYDDIIDLTHPVSRTHPRMPLRDRAAQFSPFAALTGYEAAIEETARLTDSKLELDETQKLHISEQLSALQSQGNTQVTILYFKPDERKAGGAYLTKTGTVKKLDAYRQMVILSDGTAIPMGDIYQIENAPASEPE